MNLDFRKLIDRFWTSFMTQPDSFKTKILAPDMSPRTGINCIDQFKHNSGNFDDMTLSLSIFDTIIKY